MIDSYWVEDEIENEIENEIEDEIVSAFLGIEGVELLGIGPIRRIAERVVNSELYEKIIEQRCHASKTGRFIDCEDDSNAVFSASQTAKTASKENRGKRGVFRGENQDTGEVKVSARFGQNSEDPKLSCGKQTLSKKKITPKHRCWDYKKLYGTETNKEKKTEKKQEPGK